MISEYSPTLSAGNGRFQLVAEMLAVEDIIPKYQRGRAVAQKLLADQESLRQTIG